MKLITATLLLGLAAGSAWAQNPDIIENTRNTMRAVQIKKTIDSNRALEASGQVAKPSPIPARAPGATAKPFVMTAPAHAAAPAVAPCAGSRNRRAAAQLEREAHRAGASAQPRCASMSAA